jgi:hypothetical protein
LIYVLSISGGKDSTALWLWAKRTGIGLRRQVAQDTGWEFDGTAEIPGWRAYLADLVSRIEEPLTVLARGHLPVRAELAARLVQLEPHGFEVRVRKHKTFPGVLNRRWCTQELKLDPMREYLDVLRDETGEDVTVDPARIERIRQLEAETGNFMFVIEEPKKKGKTRKLVPYPIDEIVKWARTERGGKRLAMFPEPSGCARWGICEAPLQDMSKETP